MADSEALRLALVERARRERENRARTPGERLKGAGNAILENVVGVGEADTPGERLGFTIRDSINSMESRARGAIANLADMPGKAWNAATGAAVGGIERTGLLPKGITDAARQSLSAGPMGTGSTAREAVNLLTNNSLEYQPQTQAGRYAGAVGDFLPTAFGGFGPFALAPGLLSEFAGQQTEGMKFPQGAPVVGGMDVEPFARTGAALAGPGLYNMGKAIITPNPADPLRTGAASRLADEGINTTAGQKTGNRWLQFREEGSRRTADIVADQDEQFTAAALRRINARDPETFGPAARATPQVLKQAADDIGNLFDDALGNITVVPDRPLVAAMRSAVDDFEQMNTTGVVPPLIRNTLEKVEDALTSGATITGEQLKQWRSQLSKATVGDNGQLAAAAREFIDALDDAAVRSPNAAEDLANFAAARGQWRDFLAIRDATTRAGPDAAVGVINPRQLRPGVTTGGARSSYAMGNRDLGNLTRDANAVMVPLPSSGTAERIRASQLLPGAAAGGATGAITLGLTKDPNLAAYAGAAGLLAPAMANRAIGSPPVQAYLANQLAPGRAPLMAPGLMAAALQPLLQR